jgi:hypothetical protein
MSDKALFTAVEWNTSICAKDVALITGGNWMFIHPCKIVVRKYQILSLENTVRLLLFLVSPTANDLPAPNIHPPFSYLLSYYWLTNDTLYDNC